MYKQTYTPEESLHRIKLMMGYDSTKTLNENENLIFEQVDEQEYFKLLAKQFMKYPQAIPKLKFGNPSIKGSKNAAAIVKAISGVGRDNSGLKYLISKSFDTLPNSIEVIKSYPAVGEESIYDAINGEWFAGQILSTMVTGLSTQLMQWCKVPQNAKNKICVPKTKEQMKYGI